MKTKKTLCLSPQELHEAVEDWLKNYKGIDVKVKDIRYDAVFNYEIIIEGDLP